MTGTCAPPLAEGEPCILFNDCAAGLTCHPETFLCAALPGEGEPCLAGLCLADLQCTAEQTCIAPPPVACELPFCLYRRDSLCDEPEGTGLCADGTDPEDCEEAAAPT
jgi:hypothetical protein